MRKESALISDIELEIILDVFVVLCMLLGMLHVYLQLFVSRHGSKWSVSIVAPLLVIAALHHAPYVADWTLHSYPTGDAVDVEPSVTAVQLHNGLLLPFDMHSDTPMWTHRSMNKESLVGHVDFVRLVRGNVVMVGMYLTPHLPLFANYERNANDTVDLMPALGMVQRWPEWRTPMGRVLAQADALHAAAAANENLHIVSSQWKVETYMTRWHKMPNENTAMLLGVQGGEVLVGDVDANVQRLRDAGVRVVSLVHWSDNELGGSAYGEERGGITFAGKQALKALEGAEMFIDLVHASHALIDDITSRASRPLLHSSAGFAELCDKPGALTRSEMEAIVKTGGVIAVGFTSRTLCDVSLHGIAEAIRYAVSVVGVGHVAIGSGFDSIEGAPLDVSQFALLTELLHREFKHSDLLDIFGYNAIKLLQYHLPFADGDEGGKL